MPTRRDVFAGAAWLAGAGGAAAQAPEPSAATAGATPGAVDPFQLLLSEGRYIPRWVAGNAPGTLPQEQFASFVGDERVALARAARAGGAGTGAGTAPPTLGAGATSEDAIARITRESEGRRVVILNESHSASRHRLFFAQVARALRPLGFTHIGAETFLNPAVEERNSPDVRAFTRGRPWDSNYGFYSRDPVFAEALREARDLGYGFFPYEARSDQGAPDGATREQQIAAREDAEAENLLAVLARLPATARVLVYVGFSHLRERPDHRGNTWFAERLKAKGGPDPLTIEQSGTGGFGPHAPNGALADQVLARFSPRRPIVVDDGAAVLGAAAMAADLAVFHPVLPDVDGRPGWLAADPIRRRAEAAMPADRGEGPVLAQALHADEPDPAVPADHYLLPADATQAVFFLRPGRYRLRLETVEGFRPVGPLVVT